MATERLIDRIREIRAHALDMEERYAGQIAAVHPEYRYGAINLIHYLAIRTFDLRPLQQELSSLAISSIGHSEAYTLKNLNNILRILYLLTDTQEEIVPQSTDLDFQRSRERMYRHTEELFGPPFTGTYVMVTMPEESAEDAVMVRDLLQAGMRIARINCGHGNSAIWHRMIENIRSAAEQTQVPCKIYMDLAGPKLRTFMPEPEPTEASQKRKKGKKKKKKKKKSKDDVLRLFTGDIVHILREPPDGDDLPAHIKKMGNSQAAVISVTIPGMFDDVRAGEPIWFDDGKIGGEILSNDGQHIVVKITHARAVKGSPLRTNRGINLPATHLNLPSLTTADIDSLPFISEFADMVGYSFVRTPQDVRHLYGELSALGNEDIDVILKIETAESFVNLPDILVEAMRRPSVGVMLARGDLAVEVGWERISEIQEEILWVCEAAHIPVIWATQILENLAKKGLATRAEITDAAMAARADCAMLNKGPHILQAVKTLKNITGRMGFHQHRKMMTLRPLSVAQRFFE